MLYDAVWCCCQKCTSKQHAAGPKADQSSSNEEYIQLVVSYNLWCNASSRVRSEYANHCMCPVAGTCQEVCLTCGQGQKHFIFQDANLSTDSNDCPAQTSLRDWLSWKQSFALENPVMHVITTSSRLIKMARFQMHRNKLCCWCVDRQLNVGQESYVASTSTQIQIHLIVLLEKLVLLYIIARDPKQTCVCVHQVCSAPDHPAINQDAAI